MFDAHTHYTHTLAHTGRNTRAEMWVDTSTHRLKWV